MKKSKSAPKSSKKPKKVQKHASKPKTHVKAAKVKSMASKAARQKQRPMGKHVSKERLSQLRRAQPPEVKDIASSARVEIDALKENLQPHYTFIEQEVEVPKAPIILDKVYLQRLSFEIAGIRSALERMNKQLDKLERELSVASKSGED